MAEHQKRNIYKNPLFYGLSAFFIVFFITQYIAYQKYQLRQNKTQQLIEQRVSKLKMDLQNVLGQSFYATQTLSFIVDQYGIPDNFDSISRLLLNSNKSIDALELVNGDGVITHVYPLKGNEVLGLNILNDPDNKYGAKTTLEKKDYYTAGPIQLKQGGSGIIGRRPLYKKGKFNGFVASVVRLSTVLEAIHLDSIENSEFDYTLVKINPDKTEETFYTTNNISKENAEVVPLITSKGEWKLYITSNSSNSNSTIILFSVLGLLLSFVCGILSWFLMRQPAKLNRLVEQKTTSLKESREKYRLLIEEASDGIFLNDYNGKVLKSNSYGVQMFGYTKEELLTKNVSDLASPDERINLTSRFKKMFDGETHRSERKLLKKDGTLFYGEVSAKRVNETTFIAIVRDITERKKLEFIAEENLVKFSKAYNNGFVGMVILDHNRNFIDANPYFLNLIGYSLLEIKGKTISELGLIDVEEILKTNPHFNSSTSSCRVEKVELEFISKNGEKLYLINSIEPYEHLGKKYCLSTYIDHTEAKKANQDILQSEKKYKQFTERISDAFVAFDQNWCFTDINAKAAKIVGMDAIEMIGKNVWNEFPVFKNSEGHFKFKEAMRKQVYSFFEQYHPTVDRWIENHLYPSSEGISIYFRDITKKKKAEQEKQKLISVIENSPGFIGVATLEGEPIFLNDAGKNMIDLPSDFDFKKATIFDFFHDEYKEIIKNEHLPSIMSKGLWTGEVPIKNFKTKKSIPLEFSGFIIKDKLSNEPIGIGSIGFNLTERKKTEKEILDLKSKTDAAIRIGKIGYWDFDLDSESFICSPLMYDIYDIEQGTVLTISFLESIMHPDDVEEHRKNIELIIIEKSTHTFTYRIIVKDGTIKYLLVEVEVVRDPHNMAVNFKGTVIDITQQKKADNEILDLQNKMNAAIRIGKIGYWDFNYEKETINWSLRMYEIYDIEPGTEISLQLIESRLHPDDVELHRNVVNKLAIEHDAYSFTYRIIDKKGAIKYLLIDMESVAYKGQNTKYSGTVLDITKQKEADNEIIALQAKMNAAIRIGKIGYWNWDMSGDVIEWSKEMYEIHEIDPSTVITVSSLKEIIYHEDWDMINQSITNRKESVQQSTSIYRISLKDHTFKYFLASSEMTYDEENNPIFYRGTAMDITSNILAEQALKESQEKFTKAFETNLMGMIILDDQRRVIEANKMVYSLLKTTKKKLIGKTILESKELIVNENERQRLWNKLNKEGEIVNEEYRIELKNGDKKTLLISMAPLNEEGKKSFLINLVDDSKRKEAEKNLENQYYELQKTNSELDSFVYSASHELRAPLSSVLGLIQLIKMEEINPKLFQHLNMMEKSIDRLDSFIKDIIEYSRNKHIDLKLELIDFTTLINHSLESLWYLENINNIKVQININDNVKFVSDSKRISVLMNNFISNAIKYHDLNKTTPSIWITVKTTKKEAVIVIKDNGVGMAKDQVERIFEMFYRVSSKVMGSGIGLYIVKEVILKLKGTIKVTSKFGEGSTFTLTIPNDTSRL
ncbi:PAS domain S-box protein [Maribacter sp. Asnod1-A12]|uniref:PAS domain S-box protein n=1 Tax=Maribacter sp. Asnod1-A12 TaxID=3160576 RepID=UPI0038686F26